MADNPLARKLKLMPGQRAAVIGAPDDYAAALAPLPDRVELLDYLDGAFDWL
jgi:hypothetical protein